MTHTLKDAYKQYKIENPDTKLTQEQCLQIWHEAKEDYLSEILLKGDSLDMGHSMSSLCIRRIERTFDKPNVNWYETNKLRDEDGNLPVGDDGKAILVYYTDKWYLMCFWNKGRCNIKNKSLYNFKLLRGEKSSRKKLVSLLKTDDLAFLNFALYKRKKK